MFSKLISGVDNIIDRFLSGRENLWKAFWGISILSLVIAAIASILPMIIEVKLLSLLGISKDYLVAADEEILSPTSQIFKILLYIPTLLTVVFWITATWRCAHNSSKKLWVIISKVCSIWFGISLILAVVKTFVK